MNSKPFKIHRCNLNPSHYALMDSSLGYKEFVVEQTENNQETTLRTIKLFAKWLVTGTTIQRFSTWTKEQFENQFRFWNND